MLVFTFDYYEILFWPNIKGLRQFCLDYKFVHISMNGLNCGKIMRFDFKRDKSQRVHRNCPFNIMRGWILWERFITSIYLPYRNGICWPSMKWMLLVTWNLMKAELNTLIGPFERYQSIKENVDQSNLCVLMLIKLRNLV